MCWCTTNAYILHVVLCLVLYELQDTTPHIDNHSHVLKYTQVRRILLLMAWLLTSPTTLAYSLTHSTHSSITTTTTPSTTSYPYALTMVVRPVYLCVLVSVAMCVSLWVSVLVGVLVLIGRSRLRYFLLLHPE